MINSNYFIPLKESFYIFVIAIIVFTILFIILYLESYFFSIIEKSIKKCTTCKKKKKMFEKWRSLNWDGINCGGREYFCSPNCLNKWLKKNE